MGETRKSRRFWSRISSATAGSRARTRIARFAAAGAAQRSDRSRHRRPPWAQRQANRRRQSDRISQRGRRRALRDRDAERHGRAQRRPAARATHRVPHRHSSWRCRRRGLTATSWATASTSPRECKAWPSPASICLSEDAYRHVKSEARSRGHRSRSDANLRTLPSRYGSIRSTSRNPPRRSPLPPQRPKNPLRRASR